MTLSEVMGIVFYAGTTMVLVVALVNLTGTSIVPSTFRGSTYPPSFYRVMGAIGLMMTILLAVPQTRLWGLILEGIITTTSFLTFLKHCHAPSPSPVIEA